MRVAMIGSRGVGSSYGGIENALDELCPRLAALGHRIDVFSHKDMQESENDSVRVIPTASIGGKHFENLSRSAIATLQAIGRYDLVHFHAIGPGVLSALTFLVGQPAIVTVHGLDYRRDKWGVLARLSLRLAESTLVSCTSCVVVVSRCLKSYFRDGYGIDTELVPNGFPSKQRMPPGHFLGSLGFSGGDYVLFAGRLTPEKGCHELIHAWNVVDTDKKLVIAGCAVEPSYFDKLVGAADRDKVVFVGHRSGHELAELFSNALLFVLPSHVEGMSLALLEALSYGVPPIVSDIPENAEVVEENGFYFKTGDVASLAARLQQIVDAPNRAHNLAARLRSIRRVSWDDAARRYDAIYHQTSWKRYAAAHWAD